MTKINAAATNAAKPMHIMMPTQKQIVAAYTSIVNARIKGGDLKPMKHAPAGWAKAPSYNITAPGVMGVGKTVYVIKGELYLKSQVVAPNAKPHWSKVGPEPMF